MSYSKPLLGQTRQVPEPWDEDVGAEATAILDDLIDGVDGLGTMHSGVVFPYLKNTSSSLGAGATLTVTHPCHKIQGDSAAVTLDGTTAIANGTTDRQLLVLTGSHATYTVTINDNANVKLKEAPYTIGLNDVLVLYWDSTQGDWIEFSRSEVGVGLGWFNVKAFGAVGDGATDDKAAIQAAITAATSGGIVYFPQGTYLVGSGLTLSASNLFLIGAGKSSIIKANADSFHLFTLQGSVSNIQIKNLQLQGAATGTTNAKYAIFTDSGSTVPTACIIDNVLFSGPDSSTAFCNGIKIHTGGHNWVVKNCHFARLIGDISSNGYGVLVAGSNYCAVIDNRFEGSTNKGRHAIYLSTGTQYALVRGNRINNFDEAGINLHSTSALSLVAYNKVIGNHVISCALNGTAESGGIQIEGKCNYNYIENNYVDSSGKYGLVVSDNAENVSPTGNVLRGNTVKNTQEHGILITGGSDTLIDSNHAFDSSQAGSNSYSNIVIMSYSGGPVANRNQVINNVCWGSLAKASLHLNGTSPVQTNTYVGPNSFATGVTARIIVDGGVSYNGEWHPQKLTFETDTNLYRAAANKLKTDDDFQLADGKVIEWSDVNLYRNAANELKTDDALTVGGDIAALGGYRQTITGWYRDNVAADESAAAMPKTPGADYQGYWPPRVGSITAVWVHSKEAWTAGTLRVEIYKASTPNGAPSATGYYAELDGTNKEFKATTIAKDTLTFAAGDRIELHLSSASWAPTTADITAGLEIET